MTSRLKPRTSPKHAKDCPRHGCARLAISSGQGPAGATTIPLLVRISAGLLGHPSFQRAFGAFKGTPVTTSSATSALAVSSRDFVFRLDRPGKSGILPRIWLTEPSSTSDGAHGREYSAVYPSGPDSGGVRAEELGERCFAEGLSGAAVADGALRIQCFQAAEVCFLHAAQRGSTRAKVRLAVIYQEDLCAGASWLQAHNPRCSPGVRAVSLLKEAAAEGSAEACWLLADGEGVSRYWAMRALKLASPDSAWQQGNAWLRFACAAEAQAADLSGIAVAHEAYSCALKALSACENEGDWHAKRYRVEAQRGAARMSQELFWM